MLQINDLTFNAWGRRFFDKATVSLPPGAKVGLIGRNGVGKSTLFKLILGQLHAGDDEISLPKSARIGSVDQEHPATPVSLLETVLEADIERHTLMTRLETADPEEMGEIWARLIEIDSDSAPARASEILVGLGFTQEDLRRPMSEFSGGWRMRVALAAALFAEPDMLLLDEPTNYLDLEGALWLEARLQKYPHTALIVSHDRELLNNSCTHMLHLAGGKLELYTGGYDDFEKRRAEKARLQLSAKAKQDAERAHLQAFVDRFKAKASKAAQAQSRMKRLAKMEPVATTIEERVAPFTLPSPPKPLPPPLIRLEKASVGYEAGRAILKNLNLRMDLDDRIGLLGVNGAGKSTFAKMIAGALGVQAGEFHRDKKMKVGWFHQHQIEAMDPNDTPLEIIRRAMPEASESSRRSKLAQFGLGFEKQETKVESLSGGERARLLLNLVAMDAPHMLILDEPTNHLDIDSRRALLDALNDYMGAVILITHDRSLMELVADRLWLAADGTVKSFDGDMDDYARFVLERAKQAVKPTQVSREPEKPVAPPTKKAAVEPLRRKVEAAEQVMTRRTRDLAELEGQLGDPDLYVKNPGKVAELTKRRDNAQAKLNEAEEAWMSLAEELAEAEG
ncbi:ABC-F family ATP-binding cassette domain-containing protein [Caulobacter vibrioides]|uniref:ABC transporter, ATP-binding protein n=2 Tax=Caulobacter vibrioides TaxID=155892 RepID=Q9A7M3_CAUVC|nr:ABC-F family ATP-binding cassette domain-containing protein [Caulobacter vibrioides]YP_002517142.1 ABC transporter ATP-binding protein [Caulobacter vibrioides NA1000]AAK23675.1 ABC transporter, ATP-binding protein [Caulobacter vibrioides CB15]ACL95234.1 ABC transporter ATP-binding protein [Caulobacter vibrioides NA1000]ATC28579.1 ABC transporter ATP-binding protein [Caulobacter vibrioides]QXZ53759.1 ABC-F family ATP-binding cassette domain-containing protein [Caulobacter vibrioides]